MGERPDLFSEFLSVFAPTFIAGALLLCLLGWLGLI